MISSQDRAAGFYQKAGYVLNASEDPDRYETHKKAESKSKSQEEQRKSLGFSCVLVEKYL